MSFERRVNERIVEIAMQAVSAGLTLPTTRVMVSTMYAKEIPFVNDFLPEILDTIENICKVLDRK